MKRLRHIAVLDDERPAVDGLVAQLKKLAPEAEVHGFLEPAEFEGHCAAVKPELVFLDMEMPQAMGLEVAKRIQSDVGNIVFATAHVEYSLQAFETAVDYLLKPITKVKIERALQKVSQLMPLDLEKKNWVRLPSKGRFVEYEEGRIFQLKGQRNYTIVVLDNGEEILVAKTLKAFSQELSDRFKRIHKGTIVNGDKIKEVLWGSRVQVVLLDDTVVDASKERVQELGLDA